MKPNMADPGWILEVNFALFSSKKFFFSPFQGDTKHGGGRGKTDPSKGNPHVTRMKRERKDTEGSDTEGGMRGGKAHSIRSGSTHHHKKHILLENTYKLEPDEGTHFSSPKVKNAAQNVLDSVLKDQEYDAKIVSELCKQIVDKVKESVKELNLPRHKVVVHAVVTAKADQSMKVASRCLWNHNFDSHTTAEFENKSLAGLVTVYGIYYE